MVSLVIKSIFELFTVKEYRRKLIIPYLIGITTFIASLALLFNNLGILADYIPKPNYSWLPEFIETTFVYVASALSYFVEVVLGFLLATISSLLAMSVISGIYIESFIAHCIQREGLGDIEELSLLRSLFDDIKRVVLLVFIWLVILLFSFIPGGFIIGFIMAGFLLGFECVYLPYALLGYTFKERITLAKSQIVKITILGSLLTLVSMIPFFGLISLPAGYLAAVKLSAEASSK